MKTKSITLQELTHVAFKRWVKRATRSGRTCKCKLDIENDVVKVCDGCRDEYNRKHDIIREFATEVKEAV